MTVPVSLLQDVQETLQARTGAPQTIVSAAPVAGGCINPAAKLEAQDGGHYFLKWNLASSPEMFGAESDGLEHLADAGPLRVPEVFGLGGSGTATDPGWLLLEFILQGHPASDYGRQLGEGLARLHASGSAPQRSPEPGQPGGNSESHRMMGAPYGWHRDNFIGSLPQRNDPSEEWASFWRDRRLEPQLRLARDGGHFTGTGGRLMDTLLDRVENLLADSAGDGPSLLHGDLWSGNFYAGPTGNPVIIDPAVYRGAGEVDLAMMELFGSFPNGFREGYDRVCPLAPEYSAFRRDLYQLYYLLVHVNLFGGSYVSGSLAAAEGALRGC